MKIGCVARANVDLNLVTILPTIYNDASVAVVPSSLTVQTISGNFIQRTANVDPALIHPSKGVFITFQNPTHIRGLQVRIRAEINGQVGEATLPVDVEERTKFSGTVISPANRPENVERD